MTTSDLVDYLIARAEMDTSDEDDDNALAMAEMEYFEKQTRVSRIASRVWETPQLRSMIIDHMNRKDLLQALCLDKTTFPDVVRSLYRDFNYTHYQAILTPCILYTRRKLYIESVRRLDIRGTMPLLHDIEGFSHLLDLFPLVTEIQATAAQLLTPPRSTYDDGPSMRSATLYIAVWVGIHDSWDDSADREEAWATPVVHLRAFPTCDVIHDISLDMNWVDRDLYWWDTIVPVSESFAPKLESRAPSFDNGRTPLASILARRIRALRCEEVSGLGLLSNHLDKRKKLGYPNIQKLASTGLGPLMGMTVPDFLRRHTYLTHFEPLQSGEDFDNCTRGFADVILADWKRSEGESPSMLKHVTIDLDGSADGKACDHLIENAIEARSQSPCFAELETLTLLMECFDENNLTCDSLSSLPRYEQIAKALVQIGGTEFELKMTFVDGDWMVQESLRNQLTREVVRRQQKEKRKPKYIRAGPKSGTIVEGHQALDQKEDTGKREG